MMPRRRFILVAFAALTACASILPEQKYTPRVNWPLQPAPPPARPPRPGGPVLLIRPVTAAPGLEGRGMQKLRADGSLQVDYYNRWAAPPADAVTQALLDWTQASGMFSAVITPGSRLQPDLILEAELTELVADLAQGEARVTLTLVVIKPAANGITVPLRQALLRGRAPLSGMTAAAQARAETEALAQVMTQALALLRGTAG